MTIERKSCKVIKSVLRHANKKTTFYPLRRDKFEICSIIPGLKQTRNQAPISICLLQQYFRTLHFSS